MLNHNKGRNIFLACIAVGILIATATGSLHAQCVASGVNPSCPGSNDGSITAFNASATGTKKYDLYTGVTLINTASSATPYMFNGLAAGTYEVKMYTDSSGNWKYVCNKIITLTDPPSLTIGFIPTALKCKGGADGAIDASVGGGTPPYTYIWSNGDTTQDISGLAAGNYVLIAIDLRGCTVSGNADVLEPSTALSHSINGTNVTCTAASGAADLSVSGGSQPYAYLWSTGSVSEDLSNITAGTYTVTITDSVKCVVTDSVVITAPSNLLSVVATGKDASCNGKNDGSITLSVTGGIPAYSFQWSNNDTARDISGLSPGAYTVTVSDAALCTITTSASISEPLSLGISTVTTPVACKGTLSGKVDITITGGTGAYTYSWSNGQMTEDIATLGTGIYTVTATDGNGCSLVSMANITEPAQLLAVSISGTDVVCTGAATGATTLTVTGGATPYFYNWSNGGTSQNLSSVKAGTYTVTVTDGVMCALTASITLTEASFYVAISVSTTSATCPSWSDGAVTTTVAGGQPPFTYDWSTGQATQDLSGVTAGYYTVVVTDGKGCTAKAIGSVTEPNPMKTFLKGKMDCSGKNGTANLSVYGGNTPYSYNWSNGAAAEDVDKLVPGVYTVTVTDASGCSVQDTVLLESVGDECVNIPTAFTPNNDGTNDTWVIRNIESFPQALIEVFTSTGERIFISTTGYSVPWDGTSKGKPVHAGTYYYVLTLTPGEKPESGAVTVLY